MVHLSTMRLFTLFSPLFLHVSVSAAAATGGNKHCKCQPDSPCWPSNSEWKQLNASVGGNLISDIRPIASVCYEGTPEYDEERCKEVTINFEDSAWRADQLGAVQHTNWEPYAPLKETCYVPSLIANLTGTPQCKQGSIPQYAVKVRSAKDISAAVKFAAKHNIPLVIKNTGHDYLGRANRRNALMIWTHHMRDISFTNEDGKWKPAGCNSCPDPKYKEKDLLVKIGAGVMGYELYAAVSKRNRTVVAGASSTVGTAGGYIQAGGHSPLGPWKGLASDHAVEYEVVLADGRIVKANHCTNSDLFWALRGGGGSTYGVVTSVTLRTHEDLPMPLYSLNITIPVTDSTDNADDLYWEFTSRWLALAPEVNKLKGSGYYYYVHNTPIPEYNTTAHVFIGILFFPGVSDTRKIANLFKDLEEWITGKLGGPDTPLVSKGILPLPASGYFGSAAPTEGGQGKVTILGSRLLSREILETPEGAAQVTKAIREINALGGFVLGHYVAPPPDVQVDSGAHSAWRRAISHIIVSVSWSIGDSFEKQQEVKNLLTHTLVPKLKELDRVGNKQTMGAYINEADKEDPEWQDSYFGEKYGRLRKIKDKYDPNGVLWCRPCVGSEDWDKEGKCKVKGK